MKQYALKYAFYMAAGFIILFLVSHFLGLSNRYDLRILNGVIHLSGLYFAIREYLASRPGKGNNFVAGTAIGMYAGVIGAAAFSFFMCLFLYFDSGFMAELQVATPFGKYLNPVTASLFILVEGIVVSLIGSYILTRVIDIQLIRQTETA